MSKKTISSEEQLPTLENAMTEIADLVEKMEHQTLSLEESLAQFERGMFLIRHSQKILQETEQKVQILLQQNQTDNLSPYQMREDEKNS